MKLPSVTSNKQTKSLKLEFKGIDRSSQNPNYLKDAINLSFGDGCKTRAARSVCAFLDFVPDQILELGNNIYLRLGNQLYKLSDEDKENPFSIAKTYNLKDYADPPERFIFDVDDDLWVFPDQLKFTPPTPTWRLIGESNSNAGKFPFTGSRILFYGSGFGGEEVCNEADCLKVGDLLSFSWLPNETFRILRKEDVYEDVVGVSMMIGFNILLDRDVSQWNSIPANAYLQVWTPETKPLYNPLYLGVDRPVTFTGNGIVYTHQSGDRTYEPHINNYIHPGQRVIISGSSVSVNNQIATVTEITDGSIIFDADFSSVTENSNQEIIITPYVPDFDGMVIHDGRLVGFENSTKTLWISSADTLQFYKDTYFKDDGINFKYNSEITGMTVFKNSVTCFSEKDGFKILGNNALNFAKSEISVSGIKRGEATSLARIGDTLFYSSQNGINKYSAGCDEKISKQLKEIITVNCAAASDGKYYALTDGFIWTYCPGSGNWWKSDAKNIQKIFAFKGEIYYLSENVILKNSGENISLDWSLNTCELPAKSSDIIYPLRLSLEVKSASKGEMEIFIRFRGEKETKKLAYLPIMGESFLSFPIKKRASRGFSLIIKGTGDCEIENITLKYRRK